MAGRLPVAMEITPSTKSDASQDKPRYVSVLLDVFAFSLFSPSSLIICPFTSYFLSLFLFLSLSYLPSLSVQFVLTKTCLTEEVLSTGEEEDKGEGRSGVVEGKRERRRGEGQE